MESILRIRTRTVRGMTMEREVVLFGRLRYHYQRGDGRTIELVGSA